jgi:tripartite ATP-independent transporter DctP family solute receptor
MAMAGGLRCAHADGPKVLKVAFPDNAQHPTNKAAHLFAAAVEERTRGRYKVDVFPGGTLGSETNIVSGLQTGIVDFAMHTAGYTSSYIPSVGVIDLPFLFKDKATGQKVLAGEVGKRLEADGLKKNIVICGWSQNGWRNFETAGHPIRTPADVKDLKIRIQAGPIFAAMVSALGGVPVVIDASDLYLGLQQKTIDGLEIPLPSTISFKTYEVARNIAMTRHVYNACLFMASKPKMDGFAPADREIMRQAGAEAAAYWYQLMDAEDRKALDFCVANGAKVTEVDQAAFRRAMAPVYEGARQRYGDLAQMIIDQTA